MPAGFQYPLRSEMWMPLRFTRERPGNTTWRAIHRCDRPAEARRRHRPAREDMRAIGARLARDVPAHESRNHASVHPLREAMVGNVRQSMFVLLGAVGLVLLIVCVNIASLVLIRALGRGRELAVRVAHGRRPRHAGAIAAGREPAAGSGRRRGRPACWRIWATSAIASLDPSIGVPLLNQTRLDCVGDRVCVRCRACWRRWYSARCRRGRRASIGEVVTRIREEGGSTTSDPKRQRMRSLLIVAETTLAVVLLVGAGLLARSFERLLSVDLGFSADAVQTFNIALPRLALHPTAAATGLRRDAALAARRRTNVESAGAIFGLPLIEFSVMASRRLPATASRCRTMNRIALTLQVRLVTPDYFKTMGIPIVQGRALRGRRSHRLATGRDAEPDGRGARVAGSGCAGPSAADRHATRSWAASAPAARCRHRRRRARLRSGVACRADDLLSHAQWPEGGVSIVAKARNGDPASLVQPMRALLQDLDPDVPMSAVRSMEQSSSARSRSRGCIWC